MKFKELISELKEKESYKKFISENPDAYVCAGFLILSSGEKEGDKVQINMFLPSKKKIATFDYPFNDAVIHKDEIENSKEIKNMDFKLDVDGLKDFVKEKLGIEPAKIIGILKDDIWNLTILNGMDMRRLKVNAYDKKVLEEDKGLLSDFIKIKGKE
jgi:ribosomal protein S18